jgi:hypothetical protein
MKVKYESDNLEHAGCCSEIATWEKNHLWCDLLVKDHGYDPTVNSHLSGPLPDLVINNSGNDKDLLREKVVGLQLNNPERSNWDKYFMDMAVKTSSRSSCIKRRVGCVIVNPDHIIVSTGYNGTPSGIKNCSEGGCQRSSFLFFSFLSP